jgi:hypothetical protein
MWSAQACLRFSQPGLPGVFIQITAFFIIHAKPASRPKAEASDPEYWGFRTPHILFA